MEVVLKRLQTLSSDQLRVEITGAGLKCGPITATTRSIFEKKLARALLEHSGSSHSVEEQICESESSEETTHEPQTPEKPPSTGGPCIYYGVCPQPDDPTPGEDSPHVYVDKTSALRAVMRLKGARFKAFSSREGAENFAKGLFEAGVSPRNVTECLVNTDVAVNVEKANEFRSPRTQDLTAKLRRTVERGDEQMFRELVWTNPRYLIGSGDNPTIVQEGCRYNALHVAAKENQAGIARLLLETLEDPEFMRLMYPHDQELMLWRRIRYIVDLYLNTPDKASNETPLHFACKFGCVEVVNVLCSHPCVDKHRRNKYEQKPSSVICERKNKSKEARQKIVEYLEDRFYVPLLRVDDNTLHPVIGAPWCPGSPESSDQLNGPDSPKNPVMTIKAFAGPLNSSKAEEFHRLWKSPPRERATYFHHILKSDSEHGAERVGRELAHDMGHPWAEYWDFLNCFIDVSSNEGLKMLEEHLSVTGGGLINIPDSSTARSGQSSGSSCVSCVCVSSPEEEAESDDLRAFPVRDLMQDFETVLLLSNNTDRTADSGCQSDDSGDEGADDWSSCGSEEYFTADEDTGDRTPSPSSSYKSTHSAADHDTGSEDLDRCDVFIAGDSPSKVDSEVLLALDGVEIDPHTHPSVFRWRSKILTYSSSQRQSWTSASQMNRVAESRSSQAFRLDWLSVSCKFRSPAQHKPEVFMSSPPKKSCSRL